MNESDIKVLSDESIPEAVRCSIAQSILAAESKEEERELERLRIETERKRFIWNTPLVAAIAGLITLSATFFFDRITNRDATTSTITLEQVRQELVGAEARLKQQLEERMTRTAAELEALANERQFQYEIVKSELTDGQKSNAERAAVLLFLVRSGVLSTLNRDELERMAEAQIENPNSEIIPQLSRTTSAPPLLNSMNFVASARRDAVFERRAAEGATKIAAWGDSWFQYPILLQDVVDQMSSRFAIKDFSSAGIRLDEMIMNPVTLEKGSFKAVLICGGLSELIDFESLHGLATDASAGTGRKYELEPSFRDHLISISTKLEMLVSNVRRQDDNVPIILHGYDYIVPGSGVLGNKFESRGVSDPTIMREITSVVIDTFYSILLEKFSGRKNVVVVDLRNTVKDEEWHDEVHPTNSGFAKVAEKLQQALDQI